MIPQEKNDLRSAQDRAKQSAAEMVKRIPRTLQKSEENIAQQVKHHKGNPFTKLALLHRLLDEFGAVAKPYVACKSGCAACCHYNVSLLPVEAEYIERTTGHKRLPDPLKPQDFHGQPCPFLKHGSCSVYRARPISCRMHVSFAATPYWCDPDRSSAGEFRSVDLTGIREALIDIAKGYGGLGHTDIRQVFKARPSR